MDKKLINVLIANVLLVAIGALGLYLLPLTFYSASFIIIILNIIFSLTLVVFVLWKKELAQIPELLLSGRYVVSVLLVDALALLLVEAFFNRTLFDLADCFNELLVLLVLLAISAVSFIYFEADRRLNYRKMFYKPVVLLLVYLIVAWVLKLPYAFIYEPVWAIGFSVALAVLTYLIARWMLFASQSHAPRIRKSRL